MDNEIILGYIDYFEDLKEGQGGRWEESTICNGRKTLRYPVYDNKFESFIRELYKTDLLKGDYLEYIDKNNTDFDNIDEVIKESNIELLKAILTYYVRQERFCDGFWIEAIDRGIFLKILYRLKEKFMVY